MKKIEPTEKEMRDYVKKWYDNRMDFIVNNEPTPTPLNYNKPNQMKKTRTKKAKKETISVEILNYALGEIYKRLEGLERDVKIQKDRNMGIIHLVPEDFKEEAPVKIGRWKPEMGEMYYCVEGIDEHCYQWSDYLADNSRWSIGNCYKTEEEAEKAKERMILKQEYVDFCTELNNGEQVDWKNQGQTKFYLTYSSPEERVNRFRDWETVIEGTTYCLDSNLLDKALEKFGEEKLKVILGV